MTLAKLFTLQMSRLGPREVNPLALEHPQLETWLIKLGQTSFHQDTLVAGTCGVTRN